MSIKNLIREEIRDELDGLNKMKLGDDEFKATADVTVKLIDRLNKMEEIELEREKIDIDHKKVDIEQQKADDDRKDKKVKNAIAIGTGFCGMAVTVAMCLLSLVSEEKGIINSTQVGRKFFDRGTNFFFKK